MLPLVTEARDVAAEIGDIELQAEAAEWRLAALIALGELSTAAAELADVLAMARRMHQPFPIHVAEHYGSRWRSATATWPRSEAAAERSREWSQLLSRPRCLRRLRRADVQRPPRAGPAGRAGAGGAGAGGPRPRAAAPGGRGWRR